MSEGKIQQFPEPDPELQRLSPLVGDWTTEAQTQDSPLGPGVKVTSREKYYWLEGGYFLVSTWETVFGDEAPQKGVMYWGYDAKTKKFRTHFFDKNGPFDEDGSRYEGEVGNGKLTFTGPARFQYDLDADGKIKVNDDGSITAVWWLRNENREWKPWMTNRFFKVK